MSSGGRAVIAAGLVVLSVVAWATAGEAQDSSATPPARGDVQVLRERVAAFWAARFAGDSKGQWELLEPRGRGRMTPQEYAGGPSALRYLAYQVEDAVVNGFFATVAVRVIVQPILPSAARAPMQTVVVQDRWIRIGGVWYRSVDDEGPDPAPGRRS